MCESDKNCIVINIRYLKRWIDSIDLLDSFMLLIEFQSCGILVFYENNKNIFEVYQIKIMNYKLKILYLPDYCFNGDGRLN